MIVYVQRPGVKRKKKKRVNEKKLAENKRLFYTTHRLCMICQRPIDNDQSICHTCEHKMYKLPVHANVGVLMAIKEKYGENPFDVIKRDVQVLYDALENTTEEERHNAIERSILLEKHDNFMRKKYDADSEIPDFLKEYERKHELLDVTGVEGNIHNPIIYFKCKECGREICVRYRDLRKASKHNCIANKSSGELEVADYLKHNNIKYKEQRHTLYCVNPKTGLVMPYDFDLPESKIIIEVQGEQHYKYTPMFHSSEDDFQYQLWRDAYKKKFAEERGYKVLYINYDEIKSGRYRAKIQKAISKAETGNQRSSEHT